MLGEISVVGVGRFFAWLVWGSGRVVRGGLVLRRCRMIVVGVSLGVDGGCVRGIMSMGRGRIVVDAFAWTGLERVG